ncbi:MAG: hypothetical protein MZV70_33605 [Desulfobacterales bacterium]|nr:hypothetical protein [Desulfobacterales bacterium]
MTTFALHPFRSFLGDLLASQTYTDVTAQMGISVPGLRKRHRMGRLRRRQRRAHGPSGFQFD